jgi:hypothetical protein
MPFLKKMEELLKTDEAKSVHNAAVRVVKDVPRGSAAEESIIRRLGRRYKKLKLFGSERN